MSLEELYTEYKDMVFNLALNYIQNYEDAQEITQDVFVAVHKSLDSFRHQSNVSTWIYRITINKSLDYIKARKRKRRFGLLTSLFVNSGEQLFEPGHFDHPGVQLEQKEAVAGLFRHINNLPPNQKTALLLNKTEGKSQAEVAEIMDISPKAAESLIQRAKTNLSKMIQTSEGK